MNHTAHEELCSLRTAQKGGLVEFEDATCTTIVVYRTTVLVRKRRCDENRILDPDPLKSAVEKAGSFQYKLMPFELYVRQSERCSDNQANSIESFRFGGVIMWKYVPSSVFIPKLMRGNACAPSVVTKLRPLFSSATSFSSAPRTEEHAPEVATTSLKSASRLAAVLMVCSRRSASL